MKKFSWKIGKCILGVVHKVCACSDGSMEAAIRSHYAELNKFGQNGEYEKAIKTANKILTLNPDELQAAHCKGVSLIQISKFNEAIQFIERTKINQLVFERAYIKYRLNQPEKALKTIDNCDVKPLPDNLKELRAQVLYRLEMFDECFEAYKNIIKNSSDEYEDERATNLSAVAANLAIEGSTKDFSNLREDTYELTYNSACALAGRGKFNEAEKKLRASEKMCRETLEEDGSTEDDIQDESAIIKVQLAHCLQMQGKSKEAFAIYADALKLKSDDVAIISVCSNNTVAINKDQNVFDSKKKIRATLNEACEHKLTSRQNKTIAINNCLLTLYTNQTDQCHQFVSKLVQTYPDIEFDGVLIRASQFAKDKKFKEAVELLDKYNKAHPENDLPAKFAITQLLLLNGNKKGAIDVLQSLGEAKYRPGVVSAIVSLLLGSDNKAAASQVLKDAVEWYKKSKINSGDLTDMWRQAATFHLRGGEAATAASSLEELRKSNPQDMKILAQLVLAYAQFDPSKAQEASKKLPALDTLTNASEIDSLEATNWMMSTKAVKKTASKVEQSPGTPGSELGKQKKKRQRKRKGKLPKEYNIDVLPDPERWLPKYERTGFRRKRDKRSKDVIKGSQGMSSGAADQYDMSKAQNLLKVSPAPTSSAEPTPGPRQHQRKSHAKKKKGRF